MGLIKAAIGAVGGVLADQWKEYFYCDAMNEEVLAMRGRKRTSGRSSNTKGNDNIITSGSVIAVADGQCMIIVEQGKVVELCAEPGEFIFDASTEGSVFAGGLNSGLFSSIGRRIAFGGEAPKDQRVYYFNTKELPGMKYGTPSPIPFRVVDQRAGIDVDISIRCFGEYSLHMCNPVAFYTNVCGNVADVYYRNQLDGQLKTELLTALQPAFARLSEMGIRYSAIPGHTTEIADSLNSLLSAKWRDKRGLEIVEFGVSSVKASEEDEAMLKELQTYQNPTAMAAHLGAAQADAMKAAARNTSGAPMAFMGMNMANNMGGMNAQSLYNMAPPKQVGWTCRCGAQGIEGNFCPECGQRKPMAGGGWVCRCGASNTGNFCTQCGSKRLVYRCDKCGFTPADPSNPPKFCPNCGDPFDGNDAQ